MSAVSRVGRALAATPARALGTSSSSSSSSHWDANRDRDPNRTWDRWCRAARESRQDRNQNRTRTSSQCQRPIWVGQRDRGDSNFASAFRSDRDVDPDRQPNLDRNRELDVAPSALSMEYEAIKVLNRLQTNAQTLQQTRRDHGRQASNQLPLVERYLQRCQINVGDLDRLNVIHVSGTKGKGSTCAFTERILHKLGFKTGLYTSPHLVQVRERIRINGQPISEQLYTKYFWEIYNRLNETMDSGNPMPAYFRFLTIMAFHVFLQEKVDLAVVEVGIGGAFDCTNIVRKPTVCGVASLGMDHMSILGNTKIGKAIVPILVGPVDIPFQLKHLTCLDAADPNFLVKLEAVLRTPNSLIELSATLPSPSRMMHNGMLLQVMRPREQNLEPWKVGTFNEYMIPLTLGWIVSLQDFMKAMLIINKMPKTASVFSENEKRERCKRLLHILMVALIVAFIAIYYRFIQYTENRLILPASISGLVLLLALLLGTLWYVWTWPRHEYRRQQARLHERVGEANRVFITRSIMAGCGPRGELLFVYMCVEQCRVVVCDMLNACLSLTPAETEELFAKALRLFSCAYVATAVNKGFAPKDAGGAAVSHVEEGMCFCEYVQHVARVHHKMPLGRCLIRRNKVMVSKYKLSDIYTEANTRRTIWQFSN